MKKKAVGAIVTISILGIGAWFWLSERTTQVQVVPVLSKDVVEVYVATGRLNSPIVSNVGTELAGRVATVHVESGARPTAGQALVDLQPMDAKLSVQQAEARLAISERELARTRTGPTRAQLDDAKAALSSAEATLAQTKSELARSTAMARDGVQTTAAVERATTDVRRAESQVASAQARIAELREQPRAEDIRVAQARVAEAQANLDQTKAALGKTTITAPFDGLVTNVEADPGENVAPGQTLLTLAKTEGMEIFAEVDEDYFLRIAPGQGATLVFPSMPEERFGAKVIRVGPDVDSERGVVGIYLKPDSVPAHIVPGLTVDIAIELKRLPEARAVPRSAVVFEDSKAYVYVVEDGQARRREIKVVAEGEEDLAIQAESLPVSVIKNAAPITEGDAVRAKEAK